MDVLPLHTHLTTNPIERRHNPRYASWEKGYRAYRPCLRWDFGFTCSFCLLHEVDFVLLGTRGLPIFTAEHIELQSKDDTRANDYSNIVYCCIWCNRARGVIPRGREEYRLLDPTKDAWADFFKLKDDIFIALDQESALYTLGAYNLNDDRKVQLRAHRHTEISNLIRWITQWADHIQEIHHHTLFFS
jgi:hypothetical protein